jgi:hypothetical protein
MKHRLIATLGAVAVAGAVSLGVTGTAFAMTPAPSASQADCDNAAGLTATAQANLNNQLAVVTARLKELGVTTSTISQAEALLNSGPLTDAMKVQLLQMVYAEHIQGQVTAQDGTNLALVLDMKVRLDGAEAVQNLACLGFTPTPPATTAPAANPGAIIAPATPLPTVAPGTGGGGAFNGNN